MQLRKVFKTVSAEAPVRVRASDPAATEDTAPQAED